VKAKPMKLTQAQKKETRVPRPDYADRVIEVLKAEKERRRIRREAREARAREAELRKNGRWFEPGDGPLDFQQFCRESRDLIVAGLKRELPNYISDRLQVEWAREAKKALDASPTYGRNFLLRHSDPAYHRATMGAFFDGCGDSLDSRLDDLHHFRLWADGTYGGGWAWSATLDSHFQGARLAIENFLAGVWAPEVVVGHVMMVIAELEQMPNPEPQEEATE